ncbi:acyl-CoA dehydrogenase family protein [Pseudomonas putida]|nr:acyl-CoA dehydrogenase family protein [Pseudomonas putida]
MTTISRTLETLAGESAIDAKALLLSPHDTLSTTAKQMRMAVAELVPLLRKQADEAERQRFLTTDASQRLGEIGVFDLGTPLEFGGLAAGARDLVEVLREVGRGDGSAGWLTATAANNHLLVVAYPAEAVREVFDGSPSNCGPRLVGASIFARQVGSAKAVEGGWLVRGRWGFASGCRTAQWAMVGVDIEGSTARGLALLPREAYTILDDWNTAGMAATASNTILTEHDVFVPAHRLFDLSELPQRMGTLKDRYQGAAFTWRDQARIVVITLNLAAVALGMAEGAMECFMDMAPKRTPFNLPYPTIADCPGAQISAGKGRAAIDVARASIEHAANGIDRLSEAGMDLSPPEATRLHMELVYAIQLCADAIAELEAALGSSAFALSNPVQRFHRDIRVLCSHGAIRFDPLAELSGRDVLGRTAPTMFAGGLPDVGNQKGDLK